MKLHENFDTKKSQKRGFIEIRFLRNEVQVDYFALLCEIHSSSEDVEQSNTKSFVNGFANSLRKIFEFW